MSLPFLRMSCLVHNAAARHPDPLWHAAVAAGADGHLGRSPPERDWWCNGGSVGGGAGGEGSIGGGAAGGEIDGGGAGGEAGGEGSIGGANNATTVTSSMPNVSCSWKLS